MQIWRSLLFVPANQERMLNKLGELPADGFIFDLEDTIPALEEIASEVHSLGGRAYVQTADLQDGAAIKDFIDAADRTLGGINVLVNVAGVHL